MNRLSRESSLYLRQHQENPVDWYPWGEEAFAAARAEDKPVLLSVGYSTCHWCHVMAHESFSDPEVAELQNRLFVSIKVDREERPGVDRIYMEALLALTGSGGWPMTVFLLPDGRPYFAGTYFPPRDRGGLPAFRRVLLAAAAAYRDRRPDLEATAHQLALALGPSGVNESGAAPSREELATASERVLAGWDPDHGGLRGSPKFPQAPLLEFLQARAALRGDQEAGRAVGMTLRRMAEGGIHDQLEGGFHRYSVDGRWGVPHFEKMLYDQAQLIPLYLHHWQLQGDEGALAVAVQTAEFVVSGLGLPSGGFAAALDADSAGREGLTYLWTREQLESAGGEVWREYWRLDPGARVDGEFVLQAALPWGQLPPGAAEARSRLLAVRAKRPQPQRDDKVVVAWNAQAASALAELGLLLSHDRFLTAALRCALLLCQSARDLEGGLTHLLYGSSSRHPATLEDRAALGLCGLWMHEVTGDGVWVERALELAESAERLHRDGQGLWHETAAGADHLLPARPTVVDDGATRSGISQMVSLCWRLWQLTGEASWAELAEVAASRLGRGATGQPLAFGGLLADLEVMNAGATQLAIAAAPGEHLQLLRQARSHFLPTLVVAVGTGTESDPQLAAGRPALGGMPTAYVCRDFSCRMPTTLANELDEQLSAARTGGRMGG
ncbi:MAG: thioredoxin domain-containing protein [Candidatus Dormibacteria bacterium]